MEGWTLFWMVLGGLALWVWLRRQARMPHRRPRGPVLDDDTVRRIVEQGVIHTDEDEPLDMDDIAEQERRFWEEDWDEPEEW